MLFSMRWTQRLSTGLRRLAQALQRNCLDRGLSRIRDCADYPCHPASALSSLSAPFAALFCTPQCLSLYGSLSPFIAETLIMSGTPLEATAEATYTLSALAADGDGASLTYTLDVQLPSPDLDGDGQVNFADFSTFAGKFGSRRGQARYDARCDLNGDFLIFAASFGSAC